MAFRLLMFVSPITTAGVFEHAMSSSRSKHNLLVSSLRLFKYVVPSTMTLRSDAGWCVLKTVIPGKQTLAT